MTTRRHLIRASLLAVLIGLGAIVGRETVEVNDGTGEWDRVSSRFVLPWQPSWAASELPKMDQHAGVRVTRWQCYGLAFRHTQHHYRAAGSVE